MSLAMIIGAVGLVVAASIKVSVDLFQGHPVMRWSQLLLLVALGTVLSFVVMMLAAMFGPSFKYWVESVTSDCVKVYDGAGGFMGRDCG